MIRVAGVEEESIVDGEGIRYVVFCQGCKHHCEGCHNPDLWNFYDGEWVDPETIYERMQQNELLSGLTLSGGDPIEQAYRLIPLAKKVKQKYTVWLYTGYLFEDLLKNKDARELLNYVDVVVDGPFILKERDLTLRFKGSKNQRIIDVKKSLSEGKTIIYELND